MPTRRFPATWSVDEVEACFVVKDSAGQKLAFVDYEDEPGRRSAAKLLTKDSEFSPKALGRLMHSFHTKATSLFALKVRNAFTVPLYCGHRDVRRSGDEANC